MSSQLYEITLVYTGSWVNQSNGHVQGATLTIPAQNSAYLIAFLALFVRFAGGHFCDIFCYALFQTRTTKVSPDALYHQLHAMIRNFDSDTNASWQFLRLGWYWRKRARRAWGRTLPLSLTVFINVISGRLVCLSRKSQPASTRCGTWPDPFLITTVTPYVGLEDCLFDSLSQTWQSTASLFAAKLLWI
jgi:hypothetical protein